MTFFLHNLGQKILVHLASQTLAFQGWIWNLLAHSVFCWTFSSTLTARQKVKYDYQTELDTPQTREAMKEGKKGILENCWRNWSSTFGHIKRWSKFQIQILHVRQTPFSQLGTLIRIRNSPPNTYHILVKEPALTVTNISDHFKFYGSCNKKGTSTSTNTYQGLFFQEKSSQISTKKFHITST